MVGSAQSTYCVRRGRMPRSAVKSLFAALIAIYAVSTVFLQSTIPMANHSES